MFYCPECNPEFELTEEPTYDTLENVKIPPSFIPKYGSVQEEKKSTTTHAESQTYENDENKDKKKEKGEEKEEEKEIEPTIPAGVVIMIKTPNVPI